MVNDPDSNRFPEGSREAEGDQMSVDAAAMARMVRQEMMAEDLPGSESEATRHAEHAGDWIGRYQLVRRIGEGGMGTVWEALQTDPVERRVALKIIKLGMDTERVVARFRAERQALARMEHSHVSGVLDGGSTEQGRPYFVMELIDGLSITRYCETNQLGLGQRLELFLQVGSAVQHAHQKGVIHRDIKPSNVLVTEVSGGPSVKVIDFGIAKIVGAESALETRLTASIDVIGTLEYMAPEQALGGSEDVDIRTDVYSLGVLLFELLTGKLPFESAADSSTTLEDALRAIRETEPLRASEVFASQASGQAQGKGPDRRRLQSALESELDWIILKALEKDRSRRYPSVASLSDDVRCFLAGETISARPPSVTYRITKFVRRNRLLVASLAAATVLLAAGIAGTSYGLFKALRANEAMQEAIDEKEAQRALATESNAVLASMLIGVAPRLARGRDTELLIALLDDTSTRLKNGEVEHPLVAADLDMTMGAGYQALGRPDQALVHSRRAQAILLRELGPEDPATLKAMFNMGMALRSLEQADEAFALLESTLGTQTQVLGETHADTLATRRVLGSLLHRMGRLDESKAHLEFVVDTERRLLSDEERAKVPSLAELGTLEFYGLKDFVRGKVLMTEALELITKYEGTDHPWALRYTETLSQIKAQLGDLDGSLAMCASLSEQYAKIFGAEHRETLAAEGNRAFTLRFAGRMEEGDALMRQVLETQIRVLGANAADTLWTRSEVAMGDARRGDFEAAIKELRAVVQVVEARGFPDFDGRSNLVEALEMSGDLRAASKELTALCSKIKEALGPDHPMLQAMEGRLRGIHNALEAQARQHD